MRGRRSRLSIAGFSIPGRAGLWAAALLGAALALSGCPEDDGAGPGGTGLGGLQFLIGPNGGTVDVDGVVLVIPPGAVGEDTEIGMVVTGTLPALGWPPPPGFGSAGVELAVTITPDLLPLERPATLTLPVAGAGPSDVVLAAIDAAPTGWVAVPALDRSLGDELTASIGAFGRFALVHVDDGACPCFDGDDVAGFVAQAESREATLSHTLRPPFGGLLQAEGTAGLMHLAVRAEDGNPSWCAAVANAPGLFEVYFPGLEGGPRNRVRLGSEQADHAAPAGACQALLTASIEGDVGARSLFGIAGLPQGERVVLALTDGNPFVIDQSELPTDGPLLVPNVPYAFEGVQQPAGVSCSMGPTSVGTAPGPNGIVEVEISCLAAPDEDCNGVDDNGDGYIDEGFDNDGDGVTTCGANGIPGDGDDDCDDNDPARYPGNLEICDELDNDCDGAPLPGEANDGDGDGIPNPCDPYPAHGCDCFAVADVQAALVLPGAQCLEYDTGTVPGLDQFSGVFVDYGGGVVEYAAAWSTNSQSQWGCGVGCTETDTASGASCAQFSRPPLDVSPLDTLLAWSACAAVGAYACP